MVVLEDEGLRREFKLRGSSSIAMDKRKGKDIKMGNQERV
jgi:hypothetical protein